jgi:hypothetical protein
MRFGFMEDVTIFHSIAIITRTPLRASVLTPFLLGQQAKSSLNLLRIDGHL